MKLSIIIVSDDFILNHTRVTLLKTRYDVTVIGVNESFKLLQSKDADLLLVCHSIPIDVAASIIELAAETRRVKQILWLAEWHTVPGLVASGQAVIQIDSRKQPWLVEVEKAMQSARAATDHVETRGRNERRSELKSNCS